MKIKPLSRLITGLALVSLLMPFNHWTTGAQPHLEASFQPQLLTGITAVDAGGQHTCALTKDGGVKCWGRNNEGQLGNGSNTSSSTPVEVSGLFSEVSAIAAGAYYTCALTKSGGVKCWGANWAGQLGDGSTYDRNTPVEVAGLGNGIKFLSTGYQHTCAITAGSMGKCWGFNGSGQLGDTTTTNRSTPVDIAGLSSGISFISTGNQHTCAVTSDGVARCWGLNGSGQLGDGSIINRSAPVDVVGLSSSVNAVAAGVYHTCALIADGDVQCWGSNYYGEIGDGSSFSSAPSDVLIGESLLFIPFLVNGSSVQR